MDQKTIEDLLTVIQKLAKRNTESTVKALQKAITAKNVTDMELAMQAGSEVETTLNRARATLEYQLQMALGVKTKGKLRIKE